MVEPYQFTERYTNPEEGGSSWMAGRAYAENLLLSVWFNDSFPDGFPFHKVPHSAKRNIMIRHFWLLDDMEKMIEIDQPNLFIFN